MIAFIVEGHMERKIIQAICPGSPVRLLGANGDHVAVAAIAKHAALHINTLKNNYPIILIFDRENRSSSCGRIASDLVLELSSRNIDTKNLIICLPDRTTENWILPFLGADLQMASSTGRLNCEGLDGKKEIKALFKAKKRSYMETVDGVDLFNQIDQASLIQSSPSFKHLFESLRNHCRWLSC